MTGPQIRDLEIIRLMNAIDKKDLLEGKNMVSNEILSVNNRKFSWSTITASVILVGLGVFSLNSLSTDIAYAYEFLVAVQEWIDGVWQPIGSDFSW